MIRFLGCRVIQRLVCGVAIIAPNVSYAQDQKPPLNLLDFPNINKVAYYSNEKAFTAIEEAHKAKRWKQLHELLGKYISQFGVENFDRDTKLLWQYAKITELLYGLSDAKPIYRMVLRHHHTDIDLREIEPYYDTLNAQETEAYVPVDYYYKLVEHQKYIDTIYAPQSTLHNMGYAINSKYADYAPFLNRANNLLFFTSKRKEVKRQCSYLSRTKVFLSLRKKRSVFGRIVQYFLRLTQIIYNEGSLCMSEAEDRIYFCKM